MKARFPEKYAQIGSDKIMTAAIKSEVRKSAANTVQEQINNSAGRYDTILAYALNDRFGFGRKRIVD